MSVSHIQIEDHNFYRLITLSYRHSSIIFAEILKQYYTQKSQSFQQFLNHYKHELFHRRNSLSKCCQCGNNIIKVLLDHQWYCLYTLVTLPGHHFGHATHSCPERFTAITGVQPSVCDVSLGSALILNIRDVLEDTFTHIYNSINPSGFENLLRANQHILFHSKEKRKCCQCNGEQLGKTSFTQAEWDSLYVVGSPSSCISKVCSCQYVPITGITLTSATMPQSNLISKIGQLVGPIIDVRSIRNETLAHSSSGTLDDKQFKEIWKQLTDVLFQLLGILQNEALRSDIRANIEAVETCPIDGKMVEEFIQSFKVHITDVKKKVEDTSQLMKDFMQNDLGNKEKVNKSLISLEQRMNKQEEQSNREKVNKSLISLEQRMNKQEEQSNRDKFQIDMQKEEMEKLKQLFDESITKNVRVQLEREIRKQLIGNPELFATRDVQGNNSTLPSHLRAEPQQKLWGNPLKKDNLYSFQNTSLQNTSNSRNSFMKKNNVGVSDIMKELEMLDNVEENSQSIPVEEGTQGHRFYSAEVMLNSMFILYDSYSLRRSPCVLLATLWHVDISNIIMVASIETKLSCGKCSSTSMCVCGHNVVMTLPFDIIHLQTSSSTLLYLSAVIGIYGREVDLLLHSKASICLEFNLQLISWGNREPKDDPFPDKNVYTDTQCDMITTLRITKDKRKDVNKMYKHERESDVNICDKYGVSSLIRASEDGQENIVHTLLLRNADVNICDKDGMSALMKAVIGGHRNIVKLLLQYQIDVNICDKNGRSALILAVDAEYIKIVEMLLHNKADVNICDNDGASALIKAVIVGNIFMVKLLLRSKADVNICDKNGMSALMSAVTGGHSDVIEVLLQCEADVNICDVDGTSALMRAAMIGNEYITELLLQKHADANICDKNGMCALMIAVADGHEGIVDLLLKNA